MTNQALEETPTTVTKEEFETLLSELAELRARVDEKPSYGKLPEGAFISPKDGLLYHKVERVLEGGSIMLQQRRLATSLEEAREKKLDYIHPVYGLIWEGFKLAKDRQAQDIMDDTSFTIPAQIKD